MRTIKFEYGFSSVNGIVKKQYYLHEIPNMKEKCDVWNVLPIAYVRQFTGLHDKNGKEIYEGDILKTFPIISSDKIAYDSFNVVVRFTSSSWIANGVLGKRQAEISEVIGNIHENPELLEK